MRNRTEFSYERGSGGLTGFANLATNLRRSDLSGGVPQPGWIPVLLRGLGEYSCMFSLWSSPRKYRTILLQLSPTYFSTGKECIDINIFVSRAPNQSE